MIEDASQELDGGKDFEWAFYLNRKYLTFLSIWPDKKKGRLESLRVPFLVLSALLFFECFPASYALVKVRSQANLVIDNMIALFASWIAVSKIILLCYHRPTFELLIKWAKSNWSRCSEDWERKLMLKQAWRGRLLTIVSSVIMFISANCFFLDPVLNLGLRIVNNITDPNPQRILPFQSYYPFEYYKSPYYEFTYLSQIIATSCTACAFSTTDLFFSVLVFHASGQAEVLTEKMSQICDRQKQHRSFKCRIGELIKSHINLVRFVTAIENSFRYTILLQILGNVILTCSIGYAFVKALEETPPTSQIIVFIITVMNLNEHIIVYCLTTEILTSNSVDMFDGIYNSKWYELPAEEARYVILIMARTKYPLKLSAGKFIYLSLNTYLQIVKSIAGYVSVLLNIS